MKHLFITDIQWDHEGQGLIECDLPSTVIIFNVPTVLSDEEIQDIVGERLSDAFGFCHEGFDWEVLDTCHNTHAGGGCFPERLAVCIW